MGWTAGELRGRFTSRAAIAFDLGEDFAARVIDTARYGRVIYAAVRSADSREVFGLVLLTERRGNVLYTKPVSENMGPVEDRCPARILDLLTAPSNDHARQWRARCRARLARPRPRPGDTVTFAKPLQFTNGDEHRELIYRGGSRFHSADGQPYRVLSWCEFEYAITENGDSRT
jgi:hypothetical protein